MAGLRGIPALKTTPAVSAAGVTAKPPPPQRATGRPLAIVDPFRVQISPRGPAHLHLGQKRVTGTGGPGEPPAAFPGSGAEWHWYWASWKYHKEPGDPRTSSMVGGETWTFADPIAPGMTNPRDPGESVSDFAYLQPNGQVVYVRIDGTYWHLGQGGAVQARDLFLTTHAGAAGDRVERVNDSEFMFDVQGSTAVKLLADILAGRERVGLQSGAALREPRYADFARGVA